MYKPLLLSIGTVLENVVLGNQGDPERQIIHDSVYISSFFSVLYIVLLIASGPQALYADKDGNSRETFRCKQIR